MWPCYLAARTVFSSPTQPTVIPASANHGTPIVFSAQNPNLHAVGMSAVGQVRSSTASLPRHAAGSNDILAARAYRKRTLSVPASKPSAGNDRAHFESFVDGKLDVASYATLPAPKAWIANCRRDFSRHRLVESVRPGADRQAQSPRRSLSSLA